MAATTIARKHRRTKKVRGSKKVTMLGAAVATATAMTVGMTSPGITPTANAVTLNATTTGPLLWALNAVGLNSITVPGVPVLGDVTANLNYVASDPLALYNALNTITPPSAINTFTQFPGTRNFLRPNPLAIASNGQISPLLIADGLGVFGSRDAYNALLASGNGNTPAGYTPLEPRGLVTLVGTSCAAPSATCAQGTNVTNLAMVLVDNPFTPNGGIVARFPFVADFFDVDTTTPTGQTAQSTGIRVNGGVINVALGYNPSADFPASFNPFALANSFTAGLLPTYLLGGFTIGGTSAVSLVASLAALLTAGSPFTSYSTLAPNDLPFMEPMRLPARLFNLISFALGSDLRISTPLADALQPAFEIMVNTGYTDVQTPSEGGTYNRTWDKSAVDTPFWTEAPLTLQESLAVPGDVLKALWDGSAAALQNLFTNGLFYNSPGLIEPGAAVPAPPAATLAKVQPLAASSLSEVKSEGSLSEVKSEGSLSEVKSEGSLSEVKSEGSLSEVKSEGSLSEVKSEGSLSEVKSEGSLSEVKSVEPVGPDAQDLKSKEDPSPTTDRTRAAKQSDDNGGPDANAHKSARRGAGSGDSDNSSKRDHSSRRAS